MQSYKILSTIIISLVTIILFVVPALSETRTTPTTLDPSGNTVKIDSTANTVKIDSTVNGVRIDSSETAPVTTQPRYKLIQLWSANQTIAAGGSLSTTEYDCAGYKQASVIISSTLNAPQPLVTVGIIFFGPWAGRNIGTVNFGTPSNCVTNQANFTPSIGVCAFTIPVMGDLISFSLHNGSSTSVIMSWQSSFIYLTN